MHLQVLNINDIGPAQWECWQDLLSEAEVQRAARYRMAVDRKTFVAGRGVVRQLAAKLAGVAESEISILTTEKGKPFAEGLQDRFQFSISHSSECLALLWHEGPEPVGVDIEKLREGFDYSGVVHHYFSENERRQINSATDFFKFWTRKEALLKALGTGLVDDLKGVEVDQHATSDQGHAFQFITVHSDKAVISCAIPNGFELSESQFLSEKFILAD